LSLSKSDDVRTVVIHEISSRALSRLCFKKMHSSTNLTTMDQRTTFIASFLREVPLCILSSFSNDETFMSEANFATVNDFWTEVKYFFSNNQGLEESQMKEIMSNVQKLDILWVVKRVAKKLGAIISVHFYEKMASVSGFFCLKQEEGLVGWKEKIGEASELKSTLVGLTRNEILDKTVIVERVCASEPLIGFSRLLSQTVLQRESDLLRKYVYVLQM
jgi:hypothetical protein